MVNPPSIGRKPNDISEAPADEFVPLTLGSTDLAGGPCRALLVGTAGTATLVQIDGTVRTNVPLQQGYNPIAVLQVRTGGTASDIWALY